MDLPFDKEETVEKSYNNLEALWSQQERDNDPDH